MALAPVYVVGDYKVWNGADRSEVRRRLASVNRFFDSSVSDADRIATLASEDVEHLVLHTDDGRWIGADAGSASTDTTIARAWSALDSFADVQAYDGGGASRLIARHPDVFERVAFDERANLSAQPPQYTDDAVDCNAYGIWRVHPEAAS